MNVQYNMDIILYMLFFFYFVLRKQVIMILNKQTTLINTIKHVIYNNGALAPLFGALVVKNTVMHKNPVTTATTPTHVWSDAQSQVLMQRQPNHTM